MTAASRVRARARATAPDVLHELSDGQPRALAPLARSMRVPESIINRSLVDLRRQGAVDVYDVGVKRYVKKR